MKTIHLSPASPRWPSALSRVRKASRAVLGALLCALTVAAFPTFSSAQTDGLLVTLHKFSLDEGAQSSAALVLGPDGNFYGTGSLGGTGLGTVFSITPAGVLTVLHDFGATTGEGAHPYATLALGRDGNFYGTTAGGGFNSSGTVFSVTPAGVLTTLYRFGATSANGTNSDGALPEAALALGRDGNFYGTTSTAGSNGNGTVFSITPAGVLTTLHTFGATASGTNSDGARPYSGLLQGSDGSFYGTTPSGGSNGNGTVFSITPAGVLTTLHNFGATANGANSDGANPVAALVLGRDGKLYGATFAGGGNGNGTVFSITPAGVFSVLHNFDVTANGTNREGASPYAALVLGADGNFYGTTSAGGGNNGGTVFSVTPAGVLTVLHTFSATTNSANSDGANPMAALVLGPDGNFYGTTFLGGDLVGTSDGSDGADGGGTVFKLTPPPAFFTGQTALSQGVYYLAFPNNGNIFGYYSFLSDARYIYHFDLGYEYVFNAADSHSGVYLYDFSSNGFFYTSPSFPFPYLYDFSLNTVLYYYPDPNNAGHYNTDGVRYFYDFANGQIISK